jgi:hypothetical protein
MTSGSSATLLDGPLGIIIVHSHIAVCFLTFHDFPEAHLRLCTADATRPTRGRKSRPDEKNSSRS